MNHRFILGNFWKESATADSLAFVSAILNEFASKFISGVSPETP